MYKLLIVDDEEYVRNGIRNTFNWPDFGFQVIGTAENGRKALEFVQAQRPHAVLSDIIMPEMDGLEFTGELQQLYPEINVVLLSAYSEFKYAQQAIKFGVKAFLLKPVEETEIETVFRSLSQQLSSRERVRPSISLNAVSPSSPPVGHSANPLSSHKNEGLYRITGEWQKDRAGTEEPSGTEVDSYITKAKRYVTEHFDQKITLEEVAKLLYITPAYFSVYFKKETGQNFVDFITYVRVEKAKELLRRSEYKVKEIAVKIGYDDYTYFCKIFRKLEGVTPLEFRSQYVR
ncbi:response regulator transcription factor [Paenibacillus eucommiae]|uniref:YesN/AraC family two-component response regulator n=1 Tax=Paenibacillus eucommiae TaxID=1355755 RepID=A0ABS4J0P8_9BACL|nr:response regulator [Paenibacillus eucommiae]MBP1993412.1 YesN/AraC family two-component response regulator [Paenibacillus eucommiae]